MKYQEAFDLLKELVKEITGNSEISNDQNLIEFGLSSIQIMQIANQLRKKHIKVSFAKLIAKPTINAWRELLKTKTGLEEERETKEIQKSDKEPFGLTDVQYAYWVGRQDDQPLGGVGCHAYLEFSGENINLQKMREAWKKLIAGHPMPRALFTKEGMQHHHSYQRRSYGRFHRALRLYRPSCTRSSGRQHPQSRRWHRSYEHRSARLPYH